MPLRTLLLLLLLTAPTATAQVITHTSACHPAGSDTYPAGDTITFRYHPERDPDLGPVFLVPPCIDARLTADVSGAPPLTLDWTAEDGTLLGTGNPMVFDTAALPTGHQAVTLTVSNPYGATEMSFPVWVGHLDAVAPPTANPQPAPGLELTLTASAHGAHEWRWDFGDGTGTPWTSTPCDYATTTVTHRYAAPGTYPVRAHARNCRDGTVTSPPVQVRVGDPNAIELVEFQAVGCQAGFCVFPAGEEVRFTVTTNLPEGVGPDRYLWDWEGDGAIDEVSSEPVGHVYEAFGIYVPVVERGSGRDELVHEPWLLIN